MGNSIILAIATATAFHSLSESIQDSLPKN